MATITGADPGTELAEFFNRLTEELISGEEEAAAVVDRYYTPDIEQRSDGILIDREKLLQHVRPTRRNVLSARFEVHEALVSDGRIAARFTIHSVMRKGRALDTQVYMFGELAPDGRLRRIDQITRTVPDGPD